MQLPNDLTDGFRIGDWEVVPARHVLRRGDEEISPEPKVWGVLMSLAARRGAVVTRDELVDEVWNGRPTADDPINRCISQLRKHLGDTRPYRYIKPVTGSGYLLQVPVEPLVRNDPDTPPSADRRRWRFLLGSVAVVATAVVAWLLWLPPDDGPIRSIVVLPFENASGDPSDQYLASGFREEFVSTLQRAQNIKVKTARRDYPDRSAAQIGREFRVDSVLRGNVQRSGDELKVTYTVTRTKGDNVIAADGITDRVQNVFAVQERLAQRVRNQLVEAPQQALVSLSRPANFDAYDSYLRGIYAFERRGNDRNLEEAIAMFEQTIASDPDFGPAYLQLATATALLPAYRGADVERSNRRAIQIVRDGIAADDSIEAAAGAVFGFVYHSRKDWSRSELAYQQSTTAEVVDANAFNWYSRMLASVGRLELALDTALRAREMDPDHPVVNSRAALTYLWLGDLDNAEQFFDRANRLGAGGATHLLGYALLLSQRGRIERAGDVARQAATQAGYPVAWVDAVLAGMQDGSRAPAALAAVDELRAAGELSPQVEFVTRTLLGDLDGAMRVAELLRQPGEAFEMDLLWIEQFRPLREHPGFLDLMRALGVVDYWNLHGCLFEDARVRCPAT